MRASRRLCAFVLIVLAALGGGCEFSPVPHPGSPSTSTPDRLASPTSAPIAATPTPPNSVPVYGYRVVRAYPHDPDAYTEGLVYQGGVLYEGTGLHGRSTLRQVARDTGQVPRTSALPESYFGEGIAIVGDRVFQLTWKSNVAFVYDLRTFQLVRSFAYPTEGWGLTYDGQNLIMSDGTATLRFLDPTTFRETHQIRVFDEQGALEDLNELEYVNGELFANVWQTDLIARIDPRTGQVLGWIDLTGLLGAGDATKPVDVLNGIAYDVEEGRLFVTGKLWPKLYEISLVLLPQPSAVP